MGLQDPLVRKARQQTADGTPRFFGILNGLDTELWDPADRCGPGGALLGGRPGRQGRLPRRPADVATGWTRTIRHRSWA